MEVQQLQLNKIYQGHILDVLKTFPDNYFSLIVCSPPYWGLRDYEGPSIIWDGLEECKHEWNDNLSSVGSRSNDSNKNKNKILRTDFPASNFCSKCNAWKGQLGLEPDFNMFIDHLMQIFDECKRVLRKDGALWVNLGDTYYGGGNASGHTDESKNFGLSTLKRGVVTNPVARGNQLKNKTLVGIPDRFKIAMIDNGWICRNEIIWHKPNCMPSSVKDRFTVDFEKFFFFVKSRNYYFEQQFEPIKTESLERLDRGVGDNHKWSDGSKFGQTTHTLHKPRLNKKYRNQEEETKHRQGMNKDRGNNLIRKRNLPDQKEFVDWLRDYPYFEVFTDEEKERRDKTRSTIELIKKQIAIDLDIERSTIDHWFRYDESGFAYPSIEDWLKFQEFNNTDAFSELVEYWEEPDTIKSYSTKSNKAFFGNPPTNYHSKMQYSQENILGRNKRAVWSINTKPFPGAHFAVFPEELILPIIKSCVPKDGIVLDCFMGAGTTAVVAKKEKIKWVGIELNPEYIEMATERIRNTPVYHDLGEYF